METNLSTNLVRREEELEAIKLNADSDALPEETERRREEFKEAKESVDRLTRQLKSQRFFNFDFHFGRYSLLNYAVQRLSRVWTA